jgi:hypothetical protein
VLRVHRHDLAAAGACRLHHEVAGHDQAFLVGQRHPLARPQRGEGRVEPHGTHDRVHHDVGVGMGSGLDQDLGAARPALVGTGSRESGEGGPPLRHLALELLAVPAAGEGHDLEVLALAAQHVQRAAADRPGRAQHSHASPSAVVAH